LSTNGEAQKDKEEKGRKGEHEERRKQQHNSRRNSTRREEAEKKKRSIMLPHGALVGKVPSSLVKTRVAVLTPNKVRIVSNNRKLNGLFFPLME